MSAVSYTLMMAQVLWEKYLDHYWVVSYFILWGLVIGLSAWLFYASTN